MLTGKPFVIGVDGGATKLDIAFGDLDGGLLHHARLKSGYSREGEGFSWSDTVYGALCRTLHDLGGDISDCRAICLGLAGLNTEAQAEVIRDELMRRCAVPQLVVKEDSEIAYYAATKGRPGIAVIAGTGSVAYGRGLNGDFTKLGGHGPLVGDEGSGYDIGRRAVSHAIKAYERREEPTCLIEDIPRELGLKDMLDVRAWVYQAPRKSSELASLVPVVYTAAKKGDKVAKELLEFAGIELAKLALATADHLELDEPLIVGIGGVISNVNFVFESFRSTILAARPKAQVKVTEDKPVYGALFLARHAASQKLCVGRSV
ncbi:MAG TPA: hypothetical protein GX506_11885 [Firmicutes bacterium]|nr:hypothetical protein [Bacillota bacterium]